MFHVWRRLWALQREKLNCLADSLTFLSEFATEVHLHTRIIFKQRKLKYGFLGDRGARWNSSQERLLVCEISFAGLGCHIDVVISITVTLHILKWNFPFFLENIITCIAEAYVILYEYLNLCKYLTKSIASIMYDARRPRVSHLCLMPDTTV